MHRPLALLALFGLVAAGCTNDDLGAGVDSALACDCPSPAAADVGYDPAASDLASVDVQDAIDELAARPRPPMDAYARVVVVADTLVIDAPSTNSRTVECPGTVPSKGRALGGACEGGDAETSIQASSLGDHGYRCDWRYDGAGAVTLTAQVTCLMPPQAP